MKDMGPSASSELCQINAPRRERVKYRMLHDRKTVEFYKFLFSNFSIRNL